MSSYAPKLRKRFVDLGGAMTLMDAAGKILAEDDPFSEEWHAKAAQWRLAHELRAALKESDETGLPFAGPSRTYDSTGAPIWVVRELWDYDTYEYNVEISVDQLRRLYDKLVLLHEECFRKHGRAPAIPAFAGLPAKEKAA